MEENEGVTVGVLVERLEGVKEDVAELRKDFRDDHHRLRTVEGSVKRMIDSQDAAREAERRQYRRVASAIQVGGLAMAAAMVALTLVTILIHHG